MAWGVSEISEQELTSRLAWFFERQFKLVGATKVAKLTGISRSTIERYAIDPAEPTDTAADDRRVAEGKRPASKSHPASPRNFATIWAITRALGIDFDHLMVALSRATDEHSFEILMRSTLTSEVTVQTSHQGKKVEQTFVTRFDRSSQTSNTTPQRSMPLAS